MMAQASYSRTTSGAQAYAAVAQWVSQELQQPVQPDITAFVRQILNGANPLGVLFYGSGLRGGVDADTLLDFYIVVDKQRDWPRSWLSAACNAVLPPNVEYHEYQQGTHTMRAKVAVLSLAQFRQLTGQQTYDTTVWARFSQPARLVWVRNEAAAQAVIACVARACVTAARWAALLGPQQGQARRFWDKLYRQTYGAELRVERQGRPQSLVEKDPSRYESLLLPCWRAAGIDWSAQGDVISPALSVSDRAKGQKRWALCKALGRPLNMIRLLKAAYTFTGAARYAAWKVQRHSGLEITVTPFAEKHPLLAAPPVLWSLWRRGAFTRH